MYRLNDDYLEGEYKPPVFLTEIPEGYYDAPDPYADAPRSEYDLRSLYRYAILQKKRIADLTTEEAEQFRA